jgi:hypothetical protein
MMEPPPALRIGSTAYLIPRNTDRNSTAMVRSQSSALTASIGPTAPTSSDEGLSAVECADSFFRLLSKSHFCATHALQRANVQSGRARRWALRTHRMRNRPRPWPLENTVDQTG